MCIGVTDNRNFSFYKNDIVMGLSGGLHNCFRKENNEKI
jgi:hypothetical protein